MWLSGKKRIHKESFSEDASHLRKLTPLIGLIGALLFLQFTNLSVIYGQEFEDKYNAIHSQKDWILAPRGLILDAQGTSLAVNAPGEKENEFSRLYPQGEAFSHLLGFIGRVAPYHLSRDENYLPFDFIGKTGIEEAYELFLRGEHGSINRPVRIQGEELQPPHITQPTAGSTITLTVDAQMQEKLFTALSTQVEKFSSPGAAGVVVDPRNGAIRALVSIPSFDNTTIDPRALIDPGNPLFNRAIAGTYPPGSIIKPFLAAAALEENIIEPETIITDKGKIEVQSIYDSSITWTFRGWKALGKVDMRRAIAMSSNIYFYLIGGGYRDVQGLGIEKIHEYLTEFGFGTRAGIDIPGSVSGFLPTPQWKEDALEEQWFIGDTYNSSIGQGFTRVTPLEVALATASLVNGGVRYQPYIVQTIVSNQGEKIFAGQSRVSENVAINDKALEVARQGMRQAVTSGTVWRLNSLPIPVGAKTGTAQAGKGRPNHAWVTLFAPYDDPEIVATFLIEHGEGGEQSAVPAAKEFLEWYVSR